MKTGSSDHIKILSIRPSNHMLAKILIVAGVTSCAPPRQDYRPSSKLRYAHTQGWEDTTMLAIAPGSTLYVCDKGTGATRDIIRAVEEWATAAGMNGHLKLAEGCGKQNEITSLIDKCNAAAITSHWGEAGRWQLSYCGTTYTNSYDITLHEVGHMFGQCDRYSSNDSLWHPVRGQNCSDQGRGTDGNYELPSAMQAGGPAHPHRVTEDDRNGLLALLARNDITGAAQWRTVAGKPGNNGTASTPPGTNNPSGLSNSTGNSNNGPGSPGKIPSTSTGTGGTSTPTSGNECSQFFNQIFQECGANGICRIIQNTICGS